MSNNIHIACFDDNHIVPRMMSWLVDSLGWSIGAYLDTSAEVNYYAPYTMYGRFGAIGGKSTGWFTHKEIGNHAKLEIWKAARKNITMPLVTTNLYQKELNATLITPGIDQAHFKPPRRKLRGKGVVGVSGYPQPRKGVDLAASLQDIDGVKEVRGIGGNWPGVDSQIIAYDDIPKFYAGLDLFVCTSLIEGIPAPPLEALACGVPVLIPVGVGMLDDLPHEPGIYRYTAGDVDEMNAQIELILNGGTKHDRKMLRDYVAPYTKQAWIDSHAVAMDKLLHV